MNSPTNPSTDPVYAYYKDLIKRRTPSIPRPIRQHIAGHLTVISKWLEKQGVANHTIETIGMLTNRKMKNNGVTMAIFTGLDGKLELHINQDRFKKLKAVDSQKVAYFNKHLKTTGLSETLSDMIIHELGHFIMMGTQSPQERFEFVKKLREQPCPTPIPNSDYSKENADEFFAELLLYSVKNGVKNMPEELKKQWNSSPFAQLNIEKLRHALNVTGLATGQAVSSKTFPIEEQATHSSMKRP